MSEKMRRWEFLTQLIKERGYTSMVELGVLNGNTLDYVTTHTDIAYKGYDVKLTPGALSFQSRPSVELQEWDSVRASKGHDSVDLVFIDADHSYEAVKKDIEAWLPKVNKGGVLAGHDYSPHHPGVVKAVDELLPGRKLWSSDNVWWVEVNA